MEQNKIPCSLATFRPMRPGERDYIFARFIPRELRAAQIGLLRLHKLLYMGGIWRCQGCVLLFQCAHLGLPIQKTSLVSLVVLPKRGVIYKERCRDLFCLFYLFCLLLACLFFSQGILRVSSTKMNFIFELLQQYGLLPSLLSSLLTCLLYRNVLFLLVKP